MVLVPLLATARNRKDLVFQWRQEKGSRGAKHWGGNNETSTRNRGSGGRRCPRVLGRGNGGGLNRGRSSGALGLIKPGDTGKI